MGLYESHVDLRVSHLGESVRALYDALLACDGFSRLQERRQETSTTI